MRFYYFYQQCKTDLITGQHMLNAFLITFNKTKCTTLDRHEVLDIFILVTYCRFVFQSSLINIKSAFQI